MNKGRTKRTPLFFQIALSQGILITCATLVTFLLTRYLTYPSSNPVSFSLLSLLALLLTIPFIVIAWQILHRTLSKEMAERELGERLKVDLIANISHEVRTPLTALKGYVQILRSRKNSLPPDMAEYLNKIETNTERLAVLFRDILDLSVLENNLELFFEILSIEELTDKIVTSVQQNHQNKNITVTSEIGVKEFEGDAKSIEQLLNNLVDNAHKYTPAEGRIHICWRKLDRHVLLTVADTGIGIKEEHLGRIFERFYRVDVSRSREQGGTGLGLAIVKHVVLRHNGEVWVESKPGQGTTFFVKLPLKQD